ncbi:PilZ domain-containing protein [Thermodesulfobacteriota bacterium]
MIEKRKHPREKISETTFYATEEGIYEGDIENIGMKGVFLKPSKPMAVGDIITVAVPHEGNKVDLKLKGEIVWKDRRGVGVDFKKSLNE